MTSSKCRLRHIITLIVILTITCLYIFRKPHYDQIPNYAPLKRTDASSKIAIATFLSGGDSVSVPMEDDFYFQAARVLTYQLLHDPKTRSKRADIPFLVLCTQDVAVSKRKRLELDGATVKVIADVSLPRWISTGVTRWKDQFTKLRIFEMTEYERVLFIDADTLIVESIDGIFDELMIQVPMTTLFHGNRGVKVDEKAVPSNYTSAARSDNAFSGERDHPYPPPPTESFSAGFWLGAPSREMFEYLTSIMGNWRRFDPHTMEQSLLNYAFRRGGPMPWYELGAEWSATWPNMRDLEGGVRSLHEKWDRRGPAVLREKWQGVKSEMEAFQRRATNDPGPDQEGSKQG
jgi:alpha-N-acetylglucosamine transferase